MNVLSEHYTSYCTSLQKDLLEGAVEYSKTLVTASPEEYPTTYDYLRKAAANVREAITRNNEPDYRSWLQGHQGAMLGVLDRFVQSLSIHPLDLVQQRGWRWYRFRTETFTFKDIGLTWTPRFTGKEESAYLDAEELEFIFTRKDPKLAQHFLSIKKLAICKMFPVNETEFNARLVSDVNTEAVRDWTMRLF